MIRHFHSGVKVSEILDELKPRLIVELGIGLGYFATALLARSVKYDPPYKLISISESRLCPIPYMPAPMGTSFCYVSGLTWDVLEHWDTNIQAIGFNNKIDLCIVDSDHNYFTVKKELDALYPLLSDRCVILFHDTATNSTMLTHYVNAGVFSNGTPYPKEEIEKTLHLHFGKAIDEFLADHPEFNTFRKTNEHEGCIAIARNFEMSKLEVS